MTPFAPLHGGVAGPASPALLVVIGLATVGTAVLLGLAVGAFVRRGSRPYLLIVGALVALLGRSAVAGVTAAGLLSPLDHHVLEHGLDVLLVALVIAAVYHARTVSQEAASGP
ncbi:MAG: hypothetical protein ABEH78_03200 [Haloferacaceae archaeon]